MILLGYVKRFLKSWREISLFMIKIRSKALNKEISVDREIGSYTQNRAGANVVFIGGIHGNEPSGIFAFSEIVTQLNNLKDIQFHGRVLGITGNLKALERGERFIKKDLNRVWQKDRIQKIQNGSLDENLILPDINQQIELFRYIDNLFNNYKSPFYFIDLHTTSSDSNPFITIGDTLRNRDFSMKFPVPVILGIEEFLDGPLLSYMNEIGPVSLGFEAGHHDMLSSIENHVSFMWLVLYYSGCMAKKDIPDFEKHYHRLKAHSFDHKKVFEIRHRYAVTRSEQFKMRPGFANFQSIKKGQIVADNLYGQIKAPTDGRIFLPLYQDQGDDGFFIISEIKLFWLKLSAKLRTYNFGNMLKHLPGIETDPEDAQTFKVNSRIARWLVVEIFHLLGFRRVATRGRFHYFTRRKYDTVDPGMYSFNNR